MWGDCWRASTGLVKNQNAAPWKETSRRLTRGNDIAGGPLKKARGLKTHLVFLDESGFLLIPNVRRTWGPRGQTPIVRHRYRRDKISAISAVSVSPQRQRVGLYLHLYRDNLTQTEVARFLRDLLRHLRGPMILLWDGGSIHKGQEIQQILRCNPRLHCEKFPSYAPELNPDEFVWQHFKSKLANGRPDNVDELMETLCQLTARVRKRQDLLISFVTASDLPPFLCL
jgi:transposase